MVKRTARYLLYAVGAAMVGLVLAIVAVRVWTPDLAEHKARIESYLSSQAQRPIHIGDLVAQWDGWSLILRASGLRVRSREGTFSAVRLDEFIVQVDPWRLVLGGLSFERFVLNRPAMDVIRQADGKLRIGDIIAGDGGDDRGFFDWLFRQGEVRIADGVLAWLDEASGTKVMELGQVNLIFSKDGDRHLISGSAQCRDALCAGIRISGTLVGDPPDDADLKGSVRANVRALRAGRLLAAVADPAAFTLRGRGDLVLTGDVAQGGLTSLRIEVNAPDLRPVRNGHVFPGFSGRATWRYIDPTRWRITFDNAVLHSDEQSLALDDLSVDHTESVTTMTLGRLDLDPMMPHALAWIDGTWRETLASLKPTGQLRNLALRVTDPVFSSGWRFQAGLEELGWQPSAHIPGLSKVAAQLVMGPEGGMLDVDTRYTSLVWPAQLDEELSWAAVSGHLSWSHRDGQWSVRGEDIDLVNQDLALRAGQFHTTVAADGSGPMLRATAHLDRANVAKVRRYVPKRASPKLKQWLADALIQGELSDGSIRFEGFLADFPFREADGEFEAVARVSGGELAFHRKWPRVTAVSSEVRFHNQRLTVTGDAGGFMRSQVLQARVEIPDLYARARTVEISGALDAPVADVIEFLRRGPLVKRPIDLDIEGSGTGRLDLQVTVPLKAAKQTRVVGRYQTEGSRVTIANKVSLTGLTGSVRFTESTVRGDELTAQLFGGEVDLAVNTVEPGQPPIFAIAGHGHAEVGQLAPILGAGLFAHVDGWAEWSGSLVVRRGQAHLDVQSELAGVSVKLPPPLDKPSYVTRPIDVRVDFLGDAGQRVGFEYGGGLSGALHLAKEAGRWQVRHGEFRLGEEPAVVPKTAGLRIAVATEVFDADPWLEWLRSLPASAPGSEPHLFDQLRQFDADVGVLRMFGRDLGTMALRARSADGALWDGSLDGTAGRGKAMANIKATPRRYALRMDRLHWPRAEGRGQTADADPGTFPSVEIDAEQFDYGATRLGRLRFRAAPVAGGWHISEFTAEQPALKIDAAGTWQRHGTEQLTRVKATVDSNDLGAALQALGFGGQIADGAAQLQGEFHWDDSATAFGYDKLGGDFQLVAKNGRFLKVDPGTGRILGLVNLEALTRRLALDFSDLFEKGLTFDRIEGRGVIERGDLTTDGFLIIGPAVLIEAEGRVGLVEEDYDLELVVAPQVGDLGVLGALLANPAAGALLFVTNKLFKKQLAKVVHTRYHVSGPWTAPEIGRVATPPVLAEEEGGIGVVEEREGDD